MNEHVRQAVVDLGCRIAQLRVSAGMTPRQLAAEAGLDSIVIEQFERGDPSAPFEQLRAVAAALQVNVSDLFGTSTVGGGAGESYRHARIVANTVCVLGNLALHTACIVLSPGMAVAVPQPPVLVWPDVVVVREPPEASDASWLIYKPLIIVEVMTEASEQADRGDKFIGCRKLESLLDYVLVKSREVGVEHYTRLEHDAWQLIPSGAGDRVQLQAIPGRFAVDDLYRGATLEQEP